MHPVRPVPKGLSRGLDWLRRILARKARAHDVDDLCQEVSLRALSRAPGSVIDHPRAFVARIARNIVIDDARKLRVRGGAALALDDLDEDSAPWVAPDQETTLLLKQVIMALPPLYRDVFILNRFTGLSYSEIASKLRISVKTVEYRMSRALALCQAALRD